MRSNIHFRTGIFLLGVTLAWPVLAQGQDVAARGMAATCANCHGTDGRSAGTLASLAGVEKTRMVQQLQDFKTGKRPATVMHQLMRGLSDEQIEQIAAYFAAQKK